MKYVVSVITGSRADYGVLKYVLSRLKDNPIIELQLIITGSHLSNKFGNTEQEIMEEGYKDLTRVVLPDDDDTRSGMAFSTGVALQKFAQHFRSHVPALLIVLGDRFEAFAAASAAHLVGIPIAHISGGDVTEGAVDDAMRHCITKMSSLHFPGCEQSRRRIIQLGEKPVTVFNVGEPGVENCLRSPLLSRQELEAAIGFPGIAGDYSVVTFHPVTLEFQSALDHVSELIAAMDSLKEMSYVITMSNADAGGRAINKLWVAEAGRRPNWLVVSSLGVQRYLSALKYSKMVIGNSSSGIIEAPSLGIPTINIGTRQKGRMMAESIVNCEPNRVSITEGMKKIFASEFQARLKYVISPYGNGTTSERIEEEIIRFLRSPKEKTMKQFYDINFSLDDGDIL